jgi:hypothetical protein
MSALAPRREGGSWHVRASLAQTGHWFATSTHQWLGLSRSHFEQVRDRLEDARPEPDC